MDERGAVVPWYELEGVPEGRERVPGLLRGLVTPGRRGSSWAKLEALIGWRSDEPLFAPVTSRLFELLPRLDERRRILVLAYLARRAARVCDRSVGVHRPAFLAFTAGGHHVVPLVSDRSAGVRARAAWAVRELRRDDPATLDVLRRQAAEERDPTALVSQLLAVGALSGSGAPEAGIARWPRPWLDHKHVQVRLAAARAVLLTAAPGDARGTGRRVAGAFAEIGGGALSEVPWWPLGYDPIERFAELLAAQPQEAQALVDGLARHRDPRLRRKAVGAAGRQLRHWRNPSGRLWETVAAGLEDDPEVADEAASVFARGGNAAAPYADRLVGFVEGFGLTPRSASTDRAVQALAGMGDDRAKGWYRERFGSYYLKVESLPERWAPDLLPPLRERLAGDPGARAVPEALEILTRWGPAAAQAVPELTGLLTTAHARPAAEALGRIGPAASTAAGVLAALARGDATPWPLGLSAGRPPKPWQGVQTAAWAHWRVSGDPELALRVCGSAARAGLSRPVLRYLADLGPLAAPYADDVRHLLDAPGEWTRVGAAEAWWRMTGEAAPALAALLPELRPLDEHLVPPLVLRTVRALGAIGRPAAAALPVLRAVIASERRYGADILRDEELCRTAREALERVEGL
ncbi:hypothetical protein ABZY44_24155 [Streptomyces sp. NPDC006544]|uniref:hypothetical protein n=1 Tax=Streptomyces sp. NPDC006544 TaxID=3154583 RepID=UPI0033B2E660